MRQNALDRGVVERQHQRSADQTWGERSVYFAYAISSRPRLIAAGSSGGRMSRLLRRHSRCCRPARAAQKRPVTIDDILGLKAVGSPVVSPDGTQVLYTVRQWEPEKDRMESRTRIWKVPVAGGARAADHVRRARRHAAAVVARRPLHQFRLRARPGDRRRRAARADLRDARRRRRGVEADRRQGRRRLVRLGARQHAHRLCHHRSAIQRRGSRHQASATTSGSSRATSASSTSGSSTSTAKTRDSR